MRAAALLLGCLGLIATASARPARKKPDPGVTVTGHGVALKLRLPFEVKRATIDGVPDSLAVTIPAAEPQRAHLVPGKIVPKELAAVGKASATADADGWAIRTSGYRFEWPLGFQLVSAAPDAAWSFELEGAGGVMIVLRGPLKGAREIPAPRTLVGPDQTLVEEGGPPEARWLEVSYADEGKPWRQRHHYVAVQKGVVVIVTGQGPETRAAEMRRACETIVRTLVKP